MNKKMIFALLALAAIAFLIANRESPKEEQKGMNPRGIYKMMTLVSKQGEIAAPFDQYKICTDSVTLHCSVVGRRFFISKNDKEIFNFTGETPKAPADKSTLIYDSNDKHFTLKWWSEYPNHHYFPHNDWCIEKYKSGEYSENARPFFDAITEATEANLINPFMGTWRMLCQVDTIDEHTVSTAENEPQQPSYVIFTPKHIIMTSKGVAILFNALYSGKNAVIYDTTIRQVKWLTDDCIAIAYSSKDGGTHYEILRRENDGQSVLSKIARLFVEH